MLSPGRISTISAACAPARCRPIARKSPGRDHRPRRCGSLATGIFNDELLHVFVRNSRFPDMVQGDTRASIATIRLGERRLIELFERFGREPTRDAIEHGRVVACHNPF